MAPRRKTIEVDFCRNLANTILIADFSSKEERVAIMIFIEKILMESGNYNGFRYLSESEVKEGNPGIRTSLSQDEQFLNTDNTRVRYL
jgi:hypothetical protein